MTSFPPSTGVVHVESATCKKTYGSFAKSAVYQSIARRNDEGFTGRRRRCGTQCATEGRRLVEELIRRRWCHGHRPFHRRRQLTRRVHLRLMDPTGVSDRDIRERQCPRPDREQQQHRERHDDRRQLTATERPEPPVLTMTTAMSGPFVRSRLIDSSEAPRPSSPSRSDTAPRGSLSPGRPQHHRTPVCDTEPK